MTLHLSFLLTDVLAIFTILVLGAGILKSAPRNVSAWIFAVITFNTVFSGLVAACVRDLDSGCLSVRHRRIARTGLMPALRAARLSVVAGLREA